MISLKNIQARASRLGLLCCLLGLVSLSGCVSQAGPFVRDIQADAHGYLIIEKCLVELESSPEHSKVRTGNCRTYLLKLSDLKRAPSPIDSAPTAAPPETPAKADGALETP